MASFASRRRPPRRRGLSISVQWLLDQVSVRGQSTCPPAFAEVPNLISKVWLADFKIMFNVVSISLKTIPLQTLTLLQGFSKL